MERIFTEDLGTNFKAGDVRDYPYAVWLKLAEEYGGGLETFTVDIAESAERLASGFADAKE